MTKLPKKNKGSNVFLKWILIVVGSLFVGLSVLGIFLPLLPTTPFLLLAAMCYAKSSQRFYDWLLGNRWFGKYIKNYREGKGIPLKIKMFSISLLWLTTLFSAFYVVNNTFVRILLMIIAIGVTIHISSVRTKK